MRRGRSERFIGADSIFFPPITYVSPGVHRGIRNTAVPLPAPVRIPFKPASFAGMVSVAVFPFPFKRYVSLNFVVSATRSISCVSCFTSSCMISLSLSDSTPLAAFMVSSFMRCSISLISDMAPSAVSMMETPSLAFWFALESPSSWAFIRFAMASPAGLSFALLIFRPEDSRSRDLASALSLLARLLFVIIAETL